MYGSKYLEKKCKIISKEEFFTEVKTKNVNIPLKCGISILNYFRGIFFGLGLNLKKQQMKFEDCTDIVSYKKTKVKNIRNSIFVTNESPEFKLKQDYASTTCFLKGGLPCGTYMSGARSSSVPNLI